MQAYISLDTSCFIIDDFSINDALSLMRLPPVLANDSIICGFMAQLNQRSFSVHGIQFFINVTELAYSFGDVDFKDERDASSDIFIGRSEVSFFNFKFPHLRVYIGGQAMSYCRSAFIDRDDDNGVIFDSFLLDLGVKLVDPDDSSKSYHNFHFTRNDIAVDVINSQFDLINDIFSTYCDKYQASLSSGKPIDFVFINRDTVNGLGAGRNLAFDPRVNEHSRTLYIGSKNSDCLMRIYDKRLERSDVNGLLPSSPSFFTGLANSDIQNWTRLEVQLRNDRSRQFTGSSLQNPGGFLKFIERRFSCCFRSYGAGKPQAPFPFWTNFFAQFVHSPLYLNNHFVQLYKAPILKAQNVVANSNASSLLLVCKDGLLPFLLYQFDEWEKILNPHLYPDYINKSKKVFEGLSEECLDIRDIDCVGFDPVHNRYFIKKGGFLSDFNRC